MKATKLFSQILAAGLMTVSAGAADAQANAPTVPTQVTIVASGGEWSSASATGTLRVIVLDEGFEHVHSKLWLEWLTVGKRGQRRLAARALVKELSNGFAALSLDARHETFEGPRVQLRATNPYSLDDKGVTIEAGTPGQYKVTF
jgi:hypothetical protein